jgi:hypothetical protein
MLTSREAGWLGEGRSFLIHLSNSDEVADSRSRDALRPRFAYLSHPRKQRAQGKPGARCTRGLVCNVHKKVRTRAYRSSGGIPAFPARWFYDLLRALLSDRAFLPPSLANKSATLTPASGRRDHTTSPYASVPFVKGTSASTASHRTFVTIASRPSGRVRRAESNH